MRFVPVAAAGIAAAVFLAQPHAATPSPSLDDSIPRYAHVFVVVDENKDSAQILHGPDAPAIQRLAKRYGLAGNFYAEVHPSEANYVALLGGDTFGIHDDDAYYCTPGMRNPHCERSLQPGYVDHTVDAPFLGTQLTRAGLTWKGYYESIPAPGSPAVFAGDPQFGPQARSWALYASKHSGFMNFRALRDSAVARAHLVGFGQLFADLRTNAAPDFALIVPNQCDDMHGLNPADYSGAAAAVPADCDHRNVGGLIRRGDRVMAALTAKIMDSPVWKSPDNAAIVITFDEGAGKVRGGCCGIEPQSAANFGGGNIPTIVVTNHGPRGVVDMTPYSHYSLLRTIEDAFGIHRYLRHANDTAGGVWPMLPLFRR